MCIFCKITAGEIPAKKIYEDDGTLAFLDIANDCYGHTLVIPKEHCVNLFDVKDKALSDCILTVKKVVQHYRTLGFEGIHIINNSGEATKNQVDHLHFHIIPRKNENASSFEKYYPQNIVRDLDAEYKFLKMD